jgi:AAHS family 4-hydroxybenzoate transporter-like MFS transporter
MQEKKLLIHDIIEANPLGAFQKLVMLLCALVIVFDGFDVLAIAYAAPDLSTALGIAKSQLGPVFSAGLIGMMIGALVLGPLGDKYGRRQAVIISVLLFGLFSLLTGYASNYAELILLRFLTGLGLGGAMPNVTALMTEYVSARLRNIAVAVIFLGMPIGAITGGLLAAQIIPAYGWPAIFFVGGWLPLLLAPVLYFWLPESPRFLAMQDKDNQPALVRIAQKIARSQTIPPNAVFIPAAETQPAQPVEQTAARALIKALFQSGYARDTLLLWTTFFMNLMVVYFLYSWIPTLLVNSGYPLAQASTTVVLLNIGGAISPFAFAWMTRRWGSKPVIVGCFVLGAISLMLLGKLSTSLNLLMTMAFFAGFFIVGGQISLNALASYIYPTANRSTGMGWAFGIGRIGSIIGPVLGGGLIALALGMDVYFIVFGTICLITALAALLIRRHEKPVAT